MNKNIELLKIPTYNLKKINYKKIILNENEINTELLNDNSYHIQYKDTHNVIIFFDIDHVESEQIFNSLLKIIIDYFDIENDEISYTKSIKLDEYSYHISIPKYYIVCNEIKHIIEHFKNIYLLFSKYFDNSIYKKTNIFRLPYQTNKEKNISHSIIQGYAIDFIVNHIGYFCKNYYESDIYKYNLKNIHIIDTNIIEIKQNIEKKIEIKQDINKTEIKLFNILSVSKRIDDYNEWIKIDCLIYSLYEKNGIDLYIELSKKSTKFVNQEYVIDKYNSFTKRIYSLRTLHYLSKRDNPEEYNKIIIKNDNDESKIINSIFINKRYLIDLNSKLDNNNDLFTTTINNFFDNDLKSLSIKSPYDTGKTRFLEAVITKYNQQKILFISYRISLSIDLMNNFKHLNFKSYLDNDFDSDRLIIQVESLMRLSNNDFIDEYTERIQQYDLIIIDECESVFNQFNSNVTFKNKSKETFEYFTQLLQFSSKCIFLDGDLSARGYTFINSISSKQINVINNIKMEQKTYNIVNDRNEYIIIL